tara:strand:- start:275 stop:469 length:195 start_codon:yes stop_codon:yes gene_type:complete
LLVQTFSDVQTPQEGHLKTSKFLASFNFERLLFIERNLNIKVINNNMIINVKILPSENIIIQTF